MGRRAHIVVKHEVEYGDSDFNWKNEEIYALLSAYDVDVWSSEENYPEGGDRWEIEPDQLKTCIEALKELPPDAVNEHFTGEEEYTNKAILDTLEDWAKNVTDGGVIRIEWF
jgi:hypothetical protein